MRETLLIIDGRGHPGPLVRAFEAAGYFCVYARGPLKAKALLKEHRVAAVVWKDNTGNADLNRDLARVWKSHPQTPVVHLFARGMRSEETDLGSQVRLSLPAETANAVLLHEVDRLLPARPVSAPSELNVRRAAGARHRELPIDGRRPEAVEGGPVFAPPTGLSRDERANLLPPVSPVSSAWWLSPWLRMRSYLQRPRQAQLPG